MKVFLKRNPAASFGCGLKEGETGEVSGDVGRALVAAGVAVRIDDPPPEPPKPSPVIRGVPSKPAIAEAKSPAIATDDATDKAGFQWQEGTTPPAPPFAKTPVAKTPDKPKS